MLLREQISQILFLILTLVILIANKMKTYSILILVSLFTYLNSDQLKKQKIILVYNESTMKFENNRFTIENQIFKYSSKKKQELLLNILI